MRGVAATVYRDPIAKFFSLTIFKHDFELYPFDRELSYEFVQILVMLLYSRVARDKKKKK